jgi:hypothetical protein
MQGGKVHAGTVGKGSTSGMISYLLDGGSAFVHLHAIGLEEQEQGQVSPNEYKLYRDDSFENST